MKHAEHTLSVFEQRLHAAEPIIRDKEKIRRELVALLEEESGNQIFEIRTPVIIYLEALFRSASDESLIGFIVDSTYGLCNGKYHSIADNQIGAYAVSKMIYTKFVKEQMLFTRSDLEDKYYPLFKEYWKALGTEGFLNILLGISYSVTVSGYRIGENKKRTISEFLEFDNRIKSDYQSVNDIVDINPLLIGSMYIENFPPL